MDPVINAENKDFQYVDPGVVHGRFGTKAIYTTRDSGGGLFFSKVNQLFVTLRGSDISLKLKRLTRDYCGNNNANVYY